MDWCQMCHKLNKLERISQDYSNEYCQDCIKKRIITVIL